MKKVLVVDPLSYSGHVNYNYGIVRALSHNYDYKLVVNSYTAEKLRQKGLNSDSILKAYPDEWNIEKLSQKRNKIIYHLLFRYFFLKNILYAFKERKKFDVTIFTCIDIYSFVLVSWLFGKDCYVIDHGIGNIYRNPFYKNLWKLTNRNVNLIVLEEFIQEMVFRTLKRKNVYVVHHPLPDVKKYSDIKECQDLAEILVFAPSGSNDNNFLQKLKEADIPKNLKIVAKSNLFEYKTNQLFIYNNYISSADYQKFLNDAQYILLAYSTNYNYRISAVMFEALMMGKPVLILDNNTLRYYNEIFKGAVELFSSVKDLIEITSRKEWVTSPTQLIAYSDENISQQFLAILG